jgi:hypothetical protein
MTCPRAGAWGLWACRATCPSRAFLCAPRCHARARLPRRCCLPVGDDSLVGGLGLPGELALCRAHLLACRPGPGVFALQRRGAGADLEQAQLLGRQRGLRVGVVLATAEQRPEQDRELARGRDDGDPAAAPGADPLIERAQRAGLLDDRPGRLDQRPARRRGALLGDPPALGRRAAGLIDARVKPEVADQPACRAEAADVSDRRQERRRASR